MDADIGAQMLPQLGLRSALQFPITSLTPDGEKKNFIKGRW